MAKCQGFIADWENRRHMAVRDAWQTGQMVDKG